MPFGDDAGPRHPGAPWRKCGAWLLVLACACAGRLFALDPSLLLSQYAHAAWTHATGLPQNQVNTIVQTRDGHLWFGTQEGVVRFNGTQFTLFNHANQPGILLNDIRDLEEGPQGSLWLVTAGKGLASLQDGRVQSFTMADGLPDNFANMIRWDRQGRLWVATDHGLALVDWHGAWTVTVPERWRHQPIRSLDLDPAGNMWIGTGQGDVDRAPGADPERAERVLHAPGAAVTAIHCDPGGALWLGLTPGGLVRWQGGFRWRFPCAQVNEILRDRDSNLWVATDGGLLRVRGPVVRRWGASILGDDRVLSLVEDREGSLWVGTAVAGLHRFSTSRVLPLGEPEGLAGDNVRALLQDRDGRIWAGTEGHGLSLVTASGIRSLAGGPDLAKAQVQTLAEDPAGRIWVGTLDGLFRIQGGQVRRFGTRDGLENRTVAALCVDRDGALWIATAGGALHRWAGGDPGQATVWRGRFRRTVRCMLQDRTGALWLGTQGDALYRYQDAHFQHFDQNNGLQAAVVTSLFEDPEGRGIWIGSAGEGLTWFRDGQFRRLTTQAGLPDDSVFAIQDDLMGNLWLTSHNGLCRIAYDQLQAAMEGRAALGRPLLLGLADGLRSQEFSDGWPAAFRARDGYLWFASIKGLVRLDPARIQARTDPVPVTLEEVLVNGKAVALPGAGPATVYGPGLRQCEFRYAALTFQGASRIRFQYRLEGLDREWIAADTRRVAYYTHLPPGSYAFLIRASNRDGVWNQGIASYRFQVRPYFYQTWPFYLLAVGSALLLGAGLHSLRMRKLRALNLTLENLVRVRTAALEEAMESLRALSLTDPLTGLWNRRFLAASIPEDVAQAVRNYNALARGNPDRRMAALDLLFFMVDLDHFKEVNDRHGHAAGDQVLQQMKGILGHCTRDSDTVVRWGGEEFLVVGRNACRADASVLAERIRSAVEQHPFELDSGLVLHRTCSVGSAAFPFAPEHPGLMNWERVVAVADCCLYAAKRSGRNAWVELASTEAILPADLGPGLETRIPALLDQGKLILRTNLEQLAETSWDSAD